MNRYQQSSLKAQAQVFKRSRIVEGRLLGYYKRSLARFCRNYERLMKEALNEEGQIDKSKLRKLKTTLKFQSDVRQLLLEVDSFDLGPEYDEILAMLVAGYSDVAKETFSLFPQTTAAMPMTSAMLILLPWTKDGKNFQQRLVANNQLLHKKIRAITIDALDKGTDIAKQVKSYEQAFSQGANNLTRLVRTEAEAVYTKSLRDSYLALGYTTVDIMNDVDPCDYCDMIEGQHIIVNLEEAEIGDLLPPFHPNCQCAFAIY